MAKWGFLGAIAGAGLGIALAPVTGGASLALAAAAGASIGSTVGGQVDAAKAGSQAKKMSNQQLARDRDYQSKLAADRTRMEGQLQRERDKINAGMARSMRKRFRGPAASGFLGTSGDTGSGVLG